MQRAFDFIKGSTRIQVTGAFPERFLNICAQNNIRFWDLRRVDECTLDLRLALKDLTRIRPYAQRVHCGITVLSKDGVPPFLSRFSGRWALIFAMSAALAAVLVFNSYVWEIHVEGNRRTTAAEIMEAARLEGVATGAKGTAISTREIKDRIILRVPALSWVAVNVTGSRATILVRETLETPKKVDLSIPADIVASRDGIITSVRGYTGNNVATLGQAVSKGDVLISGQVQRGEDTRYIRALGEVRALTERTLTACSVLEREAKGGTRKSKTLYSLCFGEKRINLYGDYSIFAEDYDTITYWKKLALPGGGHLPLGMVLQEVSGFEPGSVYLDAQAEEVRLKEALLDRITSDLGKDGRLFTCTYETEVTDAMITVTARATCMEVISQTREAAP